MSERFRSAFVPHDLAAPIAGAAQGPLAGLTVAVKDMYDIAGTRTGGGNPIGSPRIRRRPRTQRQSACCLSEARP